MADQKPQYVKLNKFAELTGYTPKAANRKIERGDWLVGPGQIAIKAPDGLYHIEMGAYYRWLESQSRPA